ncbi:unknown [Alistipes sp. CAG:831]|nr:unknown [Alistipes sp. CAG:831]
MKKSGNDINSIDTDLGRIPRRLEAAGAAVVTLVAAALLAIFNIDYDTNIYVKIPSVSDGQNITAVISNSDTSSLHTSHFYLMTAGSSNDTMIAIESATVTESYSKKDSSVIVLKLSHPLEHTDNKSIYLVSRENLFQKAWSYIKK